MLRRQGLGREHIDGGPGDGAFMQRLRERLLIDDAAARALDQIGGRFHGGEFLAPDQSHGFLAARRVDSHEIAGGEQLLETSRLVAVVGDHVVGHEGIMDHDLQRQPAAARGDDAPDGAVADDADRLAGDLSAGVLGAVPLALAYRSVGGGEVPRHAEDVRDRELSGGGRVSVRRIEHDKTELGRPGDIDVVDADAGAADDAQLRLLGQYLGRQLGRAAHDDAVDLGELRLELGIGQASLQPGIDAILLEAGQALV